MSEWERGWGGMWQNNLTEGQLGCSDRPISDVLTPMTYYHHNKIPILLFISEESWRILSALTIIGITKNSRMKWARHLQTLTPPLCFLFMDVFVSPKHLLKCETLASREERASLYGCDWQALTWWNEYWGLEISSSVSRSSVCITWLPGLSMHEG